MHQVCVLSTFIFAVVVDVVTEFARESALSKLLYSDDLVLVSETIEGLRNKLLKWKEAFENKAVKVSIAKMVSGGITKDGMPKSEVDQGRICSLRAKANSVLCLQCGRCIHSRCAGVKRVTKKFSRSFSC